MADWIASDETYFTGIDDLSQVNMRGARDRAANAWGSLALRGGWGTIEVPGGDVVRTRFGDEARPFQRVVMDVARRVPAPALLVVEAPMGEGKTKGALGVGEILAARFGADGIFLGMPTQATCDPMFPVVRDWADLVCPGMGTQVALLHGKSRFNKEWRRALGEDSDPDSRFGGVEEDDDEYGCAASGSAGVERLAPALWFFGYRRPLLIPFVVGTIDQLLFAATRTRHVMLRMAGLMGKVVILDEVHAVDVYMSQFLLEGLRWLGQAGVPVIVLSATLPPEQRRDLVGAYLRGALNRPGDPVVEMPEPEGYPSVTAAFVHEGEPEVMVEHAASWRPSQPVRVEVLPEPDKNELNAKPVVELLAERLVDGGCALVIRNTVDRAQRTYEALRARFGDDVRLLHARLSAEARADRTAECLRLLGPPTKENPAPRPHRLIVVATQLAEQSFDVDADLLISDLTTIDLLLQRVGRIHRREGTHRPEPVRQPSVVVTGFEPSEDSTPWIHPHSEGIYGRYLLLRTAALVLSADRGTWSVPGEVPELVAQVYGGSEVVPSGWVESEEHAQSEWVRDRERRRESASQFLLSKEADQHSPTLEGLHYGGAHGVADERRLTALVRDGDPSVDVVLVRHDAKGYRTLSGKWLGVNGEAAVDLIDDVVAGTIRLPASLTTAAERELRPLEGWSRDPWLRHSPALVLDSAGNATLDGHHLRYDDRLGLIVRKDRGDRRTGGTTRSRA